MEHLLNKAVKAESGVETAKGTLLRAVHDSFGIIFLQVTEILSSNPGLKVQKLLFLKSGQTCSLATELSVMFP